MKRNMELVRKILIELEKIEKSPREPIILSIEEYSIDEIDYHLEIMAEAGLLKLFSIPKTFDDEFHSVDRMTWQGHEFLEASRNETNWRKAMQLIKDKGEGVPFGVLQGLLIQVIKSHVGL